MMRRGQTTSRPSCPRPGLPPCQRPSDREDLNANPVVWTISVCAQRRTSGGVHRPFGDMSALAGRGMRFDYPPIEGIKADLVLVTHEHLDHNRAEVIDGEPTVLRSTAGRLPSPIGEVVAIASEHDQAAGTERGPNTIFVFELDGMRVA